MIAPAGLRRTSLLDLLILCRDMRKDEIEQYLALTGAQSFDHEAVALAFANTPGIKFTLADSSGNPIVAGGYEPVRDRVWNSWMVGTMPSWEKHWRSITKATRWLMDELYKGGAMRLQTMALASRTRACEWYTKGLLMQYEGTWRCFGAHGEDVSIFSRINPDMEEL